MQSRATNRVFVGTEVVTCQCAVSHGMHLIEVLFRLESTKQFWHFNLSEIERNEKA